MECAESQMLDFKNWGKLVDSHRVVTLIDALYPGTETWITFPGNHKERMLQAEISQSR